MPLSHKAKGLKRERREAKMKNATKDNQSKKQKTESQWFAEVDIVSVEKFCREYGIYLQLAGKSESILMFDLWFCKISIMD